MDILKALQRLELTAEKYSKKKMFLKCREALKNYKSEQNLLKILKVAHFWQSCLPSFCKFVEKKLHYEHFPVNLSTF